MFFLKHLHRIQGITLCMISLSIPIAFASTQNSLVQSNSAKMHDLSRNDLGRAENDRFITRAQAQVDMDVLKRAIRANSSYIWSSTFPFERAIDQIKAHFPEQVSVNGLSTQLNKLVRHFGDDHALVTGWDTRLPQGFAPFRLGKKGARYFLYTSTPAGLLHSDFPYVRAIDGVLIEEWLRVAGDIAQGPLSSPAARFSVSTRLLSHINYLRMELGLPITPQIALEMVSEDGSQTTTLQLSVSLASADTQKAFHIPNQSRILDNNIAYLRVPAHRGKEAESLITDLQKQMKQFQSSSALIIDARQSGGGERDVLNALFPYFMHKDARPYVFNVAMMRIPEDNKAFNPLEEFRGTSKRLLYATNPNNPKDESAAFQYFAKSFHPVWTPPKDKFTDWYFMTQRPDPQKPYYGKPVYVLIDWGVGSAGDIFASAFKDWDKVTMIGTPTMGRSGQSKEFKLPSSHLGVVISTMASFQKTGERYDTYGIAPNIYIEPELSDWFGASDSVLDRAKKIIATHLANKQQSK